MKKLTYQILNMGLFLICVLNILVILRWSTFFYNPGLIFLNIFILICYWILHNYLLYHYELNGEK